MSFSLRNLSSLIFKKPSTILKEINSNALMNEWLDKNPSPETFVNRELLYEFINKSACNDDAIDYLEFGVAEGKSILYWLDLNKNKTSSFFGFDTFEGLPEPFDRIRHTDEAGHFSTSGVFPHTDDKRVKFIKGLFQDTLTDFLDNFTPKNRLVVHNDSDLYTSSLFLLAKLDSLLSPGSILIFDEFFCSSHEFQAFYDYSSSHNRSYKVLAATPNGQNRYTQVAILMG